MNATPTSQLNYQKSGIFFTSEELAAFELDDWREFDQMASYSDGSIGTQEAKASFRDLYDLLTEKVYGIDLVLDDIIGTRD
jgi:hypothetical protein